MKLHAEFDRLVVDHPILRPIKLNTSDCWHKFAGYAPVVKTIVMNSQVFSVEEMQSTSLLVLLHEARHAIQYESKLAHAGERTSKSKDGWLERDADDWAVKEYKNRYGVFDKYVQKKFDDHVEAQIGHYGHFYLKPQHRPKNLIKLAALGY